MIESGLSHLIFTASIAPLYPLRLPTGSAFPAITYHVIAVTSNPGMDTTGIQRLRIQFDCYGSTYGDAVTTSAALRTLLDGYTGTLNDGTVVQNCFCFNEIDFFDESALVYRRMSEFYLLFD